jgi:BolA protein
MNRQTRFQHIFSTNLAPTHLSIDDETHQHHVPVGAESHFKVIIVSTHFESLSRVARHRMVNALIQNEFSAGLHALSLHLYTPSEWIQKTAEISPSPVCKGGKHQEQT